MLLLVNDTPIASSATSAYRPFTPYTPLVAPDFGRAFGAACHAETRDSDDALRAATFALVQRLKANGLPPERVIVALKAAIAKYGGSGEPPSWNDEAHGDQGERRTATYRRVFRWCLDAYYV